MLDDEPTGTQDEGLDAPSPDGADSSRTSTTTGPDAARPRRARRTASRPAGEAEAAAPDAAAPAAPGAEAPRAAAPDADGPDDGPPPRRRSRRTTRGAGGAAATTDAVAAEPSAEAPTAPASTTEEPTATGRGAAAGRVRVHELAKRLGLDSKTVIARLQELGEAVKSASSAVDAATADRLADAIARETGAGTGTGQATDEPVGDAVLEATPAEAPVRTSRRRTPPAVAVTFQPPAVAFVAPDDAPAAGPDDDDDAPVRPARRRRTRPAGADEPTDTVSEATDADEARDGDDDEDRDGEGPRRRRRRGRGGRGRARREDGDEGTEEPGDGRAPAAAGDQPADGEDDDEDDDETTGEGGTRRRRRRRRRGGGGGSGDEPGRPDDPPATVVHVREPRQRQRGVTAPDETDGVRGITGSTRMAAKRARRQEGRDSGRRRPPVVTEAEFLARREAVERVMVVRQSGERSQVAVLEDGVLVEHYVSRATATSYAGNVYLGRVQNVLSSMEAAFVDIGKSRNAVLYAGEVNYDSSQFEGKPRSIEAALKSGQSVLCQVTKDPIGQKGARLTSQISLPGRYLVYVPESSMTGISRKLPENERKRLKDVLRRVVPDGAGVIVRTAAEGASEDELTRDVERLQEQWREIQEAVATAQAPALLHGEPDLVLRVVRDIFNEDFARLVVQGDREWDSISGYVQGIAPDLSERVERYDGRGDVFDAYRVDEQLMKALDRKVHLPSGGSLVIDRTEAMIVVDVNTGKYTGKGAGNLEETVTRNNLEAAEEIVRQLRLRDLGGIIVIDFIDMVLESNRELVLRRLTECLGRDRTKHQVAEVSSLGLVQMTRKRVGAGLLESFSDTCPHCDGRGVAIHTDAPGKPSPTTDKGDRGERDRPERPHRAPEQRRGGPAEIAVATGLAPRPAPSGGTAEPGAGSGGDDGEPGTGSGRGRRRRGARRSGVTVDVAALTVDADAVGDEAPDGDVTDAEAAVEAPRRRAAAEFALDEVVDDLADADEPADEPADEAGDETGDETGDEADASAGAGDVDVPLEVGPPAPAEPAELADQGEAPARPARRRRAAVRAVVTPVAVEPVAVPAPLAEPVPAAAGGAEGTGSPAQESDTPVVVVATPRRARRGASRPAGGA